MACKLFKYNNLLQNKIYIRADHLLRPAFSGTRSILSKVFYQVSVHKTRGNTKLIFILNSFWRGSLQYLKLYDGIVPFRGLLHFTHKASVTSIKAEANVHITDWLMSTFVNEFGSQGPAPCIFGLLDEAG